MDTNTVVTMITMAMMRRHRHNDLTTLSLYV